MLEDRYSLISQRQLRKIKIDVAKSIIKKIDSMKKNPFPINAMRCKEDDFRESVLEVLHLGYRILYELDFNDNVLLVHRIEKDDSKKMNLEFNN